MGARRSFAADTAVTGNSAIRDWEDKMKLPRRSFLSIAGNAVALPIVSRFASAQTYPTRPVRLIVPFAAGGPLDIQARLMAQWLSDRLGGQFVVENRAGAGGNVGTEAAIRAIPDGYTFLIVGASNTINPSLYPKLNFDPVRDLLPVANIGRVPGILEVHPSVQVNTGPESVCTVAGSRNDNFMGQLNY
jgi:tripartite-type tricarboxylate transporter receptor subunit TctC